MVTLDGNESFQLVSKLCHLLSSSQKHRLLEDMTANLRLNHFESLRLASRLHSDCKKEDCHDFVRWLPLELVLRIFSYLRPECLMRASQVNRAWNRATHHPRLFHRLCCSPEWSLPNLDADFPPPLECRNANFFFPNLLAPTTDTTAANNEPSDAVDWFQKFKWRYQVRKNWEQGRHRIRRFVGHTGAVHCLAYDAYRIVSGSADSTICVWKVCSNANWLAQTLRGHSGAVRCLELLPLPPALASSTSPTVTTPSPSVWEPPEALLISGSVDTSLKLWRLSSTFEWSRITCIGTLQGHFDTVRCVQADSKKAVSGSYDCTIRLWDLASSSQKVIFRGHTAGVVCLTYDDSLLYSGSLDNTVRVWSLKTAVCYYTLVRPGTRPGAEFWTTPVTSLHLDVHRHRLFVAHHDGRICVWHIPSSPPSLQPNSKDKSSTMASLERPELVEQLCVEAANTQATGAVIRCLAGDGWHLLCGCDDQTIKVWRADTNTPIGCLRGHEDGVTCLLIYGSVVISGSYDKNVILYDFDVS
ncbi:putative E3 ubiquitin ligase complex SCF subunit sconB [Taenia crassiceps]|uniref:E3 ubiquitin ligase complex SCF subunit sconB n=1 Tax=Taenia crassiceps TaxID=6207 RepID=A0ABR4QRK8_9CEST